MNPFIAKKAISDDDDEYWQMIEKLWNKLLKDENIIHSEAEGGGGGGGLVKYFSLIPLTAA